MEPYTYFNDEDAIHNYVAHTMVEMLYDKLERMKTTDWKHYTQRDRQDMEDKIADIKLYFGM